jgi:hypothetical protein
VANLWVFKRFASLFNRRIECLTNYTQDGEKEEKDWLGKEFT